MSEFPSYQDYRSSAGRKPSAADAARPSPVSDLASQAVNTHHPSLNMLVTPEQRERATSFLQEAYADGRLNQYEFDSRLEQVLQATNRRELNTAFYGLVEVPTTSQALGLHPAYQPSLVGDRTREKTGKVAAALAHFSVFFLWIFGPLLFWMIAAPGSYVKDQARRAFNFQAIFWLGLFAVSVVDGTFGIDLGALGAVAALYGLVVTIIGGVKASQGDDDWKPWLNRLVRWEPLKRK